MTSLPAIVCSTFSNAPEHFLLARNLMIANVWEWHLIQLEGDWLENRSPCTKFNSLLWIINMHIERFSRRWNCVVLPVKEVSNKSNCFRLVLAGLNMTFGGTNSCCNFLKELYLMMLICSEVSLWHRWRRHAGTSVDKLVNRRHDWPRSKVTGSEFTRSEVTVAAEV